MTSQRYMCVHACTCARDVARACAPGYETRRGREGEGEKVGKRGMEGGTKATETKHWNTNISELLRKADGETCETKRHIHHRKHQHKQLSGARNTLCNRLRKH